MTMYTITELDGKHLEGPRGYSSRRKAIEAAREAVKAAEEPLYVAIMDDTAVVFASARSDHPEARFADERVEAS